MKQILFGCSFLLLLSFNMTEVKAGKFFLFEDIYGNSFRIEYDAEASFKFDSVFFQTNLTGLYLNENMKENPLRFSYLISELKEIKGKKQIEFTCVKLPKTKEVSEILKFQGRSRYSIIFTNARNKHEIERVDLLYHEI